MYVSFVETSVTFMNLMSFGKVI